ncbi:tetratricopeptide repeat protein [Leptospira ognonensis]|uniref:Tetratricopeptide repeat protein n=1 Tax=Leptospira ognonensis TaxID=2484945 RepID=A0A4R9JUH3_9LEPT|nr:tetratricopeptide repeat protein [Leptospira ognonensis]TGL54892.1 tetratricopeptide repeat protein [Leptospira ognonensis]
MFFRSLVIILLCFPFVSGMLHSQSSQGQLAFAFRGQDSLEPSRMIVIGEVIGVEKASEFALNQVDAELEIDTRPDAVTIKVLNPKGIRPGQILYLLEKNLDHKTYRDGNIVGLITVKSVFQTTFFGWQVRGEGFLRLIEDRPMTVALPIDTTKYDEAFLAKKQGDYFVSKGKPEEAIRLYKKSISLDPKFPDTHFALGKVHWNDGEGYVSAGYEFSQAWKNRERFSNQQEKLIFLLEYMRFLIYQYKTEGKGFEKHMDLLPQIAKEARMINPKNYEVWMYSFETAYLKYVSSNLLVSGVDLRKQKEEWSDEAEKSLERALSIRKSDFYLHRLACEFYNSKWKEMRDTPKENEYRDKLIAHGKSLKLYYTGESTISEDLLKAIHLAEKKAGLF